MSIDPSFIEYEKMFRGIQQITRDEFVGAVTSFFGNNDTDYAEGCWSQWCESPIGYMYSRGPIEQGVMLFRMAQEKSKANDIAKRCFSVRKDFRKEGKWDDECALDVDKQR